MEKQQQTSLKSIRPNSFEKWFENSKKLVKSNAMPPKKSVKNYYSGSDKVRCTKCNKTLSRNTTHEIERHKRNMHENDPSFNVKTHMVAITENETMQISNSYMFL